MSRDTVSNSRVRNNKQQQQTHASYGIEGTRPRYCAKHKTMDMMNLSIKKCGFDGCLAQPSFNFPGEKKPR